MWVCECVLVIVFVFIVCLLRLHSISVEDSSIWIQIVALFASQKAKTDPNNLAGQAHIST